MAAERTIDVLPSDHDDWVVREDGGRELGHYPRARRRKRLPTNLRESAGWRCGLGISTARSPGRAASGEVPLNSNVSRGPRFRFRR